MQVNDPAPSHPVLGWSVRACLVVFVLLVLSLHFLDPTLDPVYVTISEYALGSYGYLMVAAFVVLGIGTLTFAAALHSSSGQPKLSRPGWLLLGLTGCLIIASGVFITDPEGAAMSPSGTLHSVASMMGLTTWILSMAMWTKLMGIVPGWRIFAQTSARLTFFSAAMFVVFLLGSGWAAGFFQRVLLASILLWHWQATRVLII